MRRAGRLAPSPLLALALAAAGCGGGSDGGAPGGHGVDPAAGEPAALAGMTAAHNQVRAGLALPPVSWDPALAATAAAWAAQCIDLDGNGLVDHNPHRSDGSAVPVGENIYGSTGSASAAGAVQAWASEAAYYAYGPYPSTCQAGKVCGHYTQLVWRGTTRVGCARRDCPALTYRSTIVCDYAPAGNVTGQYPY